MKFKIALVILIVGLLFFITAEADAPTGDLPEPNATEMVAFYFGKDTQTMLAIAKCESGQEQFEENGTPIKSYTNDYGYFQINEKSWDKKAKELGLDYKNSIVENIQMAKYIHYKQGLKAWSTYKNGCYKKYL